MHTSRLFSFVILVCVYFHWHFLWLFTVECWQFALLYWWLVNSKLFHLVIHHTARLFIILSDRLTDWLTDWLDWRTRDSALSGGWDTTEISLSCEDLLGTWDDSVGQSPHRDLCYYLVQTDPPPLPTPPFLLQIISIFMSPNFLSSELHWAIPSWLVLWEDDPGDKFDQERGEMI